MLCTWLLSFTAVVMPETVPGRPDWRYHLQTGQVLSYAVTHSTAASETVGDDTVTTTTEVRMVKRWRILGPEQGKPGTKMALSLASLRIETITGKGETLLFDSANPDRSTSEMRDQLAGLVGPTLAVVRIDSSGKVLEIVECKHGSPRQFESEPPFRLVLPGAEVRGGTRWGRNYHITLDPPQGTGEKYDATQQYTLQKIQDGTAIIGMTTTIKNMPESPLDQVPLLQAEPQGELYYGVATGEYRGARLRIDKELLNHRGKGTSYRFQSVYKEDYVGAR